MSNFKLSGFWRSLHINLGENDPVDNAFRIKFVYKEINAEARMKNEKAALGIDFFLIENNF